MKYAIDRRSKRIPKVPHSFRNRFGSTRRAHIVAKGDRKNPNARAG